MKENLNYAKHRLSLTFDSDLLDLEQRIHSGHRNNINIF